MAAGSVSPYVYDPSIPAACVIAVFTTLLFLFNVFRTVKLRAWLAWPILLALLFYATTFITRAYSSTHLSSTNAFLVAYIAPLLAPNFLAAGMWIVFGRLFWYLTPSDDIKLRTTLWIPPRFMTVLFLTFDILCLVIQFLGVITFGTAYSPTDVTDVNKDKLGQGLKVIRLGLSLQLVAFLLFAILITKYLVASHKWLSSRAITLPGTTKKLRLLLLVLVFSAWAFLARAIYRLIELGHQVGENRTAYILSHEWPYWAFDGAPMLLICVLFTVLHPGAVLPAQFTRLRLSKSKALEFRDEEKAADWPADMHLPTYNPQNEEAPPQGQKKGKLGLLLKLLPMAKVLRKVL